MFWLWPIMPANTKANAQRREPAPSRALVIRHIPAPPAPRPQSPLASTTMAISKTVVDVSRDALLRGTTFLSHTFEGLRRVFARIRAGLVHERWMHSSFDWALSPAQRLLPSAAWHLVRPAPARMRAHGPLDAPFAVATTLADAGFAMWRGALAVTTPLLPAPERFALLPAPSPAQTVSRAMHPNTTAMAWLAPLVGLTTGMSAFMPAGSGVPF